MSFAQKTIIGADARKELASSHTCRPELHKKHSPGILPVFLLSFGVHLSGVAPVIIQDTVLADTCQECHTCGSAAYAGKQFLVRKSTHRYTPIGLHKNLVRQIQGDWRYTNYRPGY